MQWIYLSPHLDDVVLSCGGIIWEQTRTGQTVMIWTLCAGDPPHGRLTPFAESLHLRWDTGEDAMTVRREEDRAAAAVLGAAVDHFEIPDCIYRRLPVSGEPLIQAEEDLWGAVHPEEQPLLHSLSGRIQQRMPPEAHLVCPLGIGGHVDHRLTRAAAELLDLPLLYYPEYPYAAQPGVCIEDWVDHPWDTLSYSLSPQAREAWVASVAQHASQISTFWNGLEEMRTSLLEYAKTPAAYTLWRDVEIGR